MYCCGNIRRRPISSSYKTAESPGIDMIFQDELLHNSDGFWMCFWYEISSSCLCLKGAKRRRVHMSDRFWLTWVLVPVPVPYGTVTSFIFGKIYIPVLYRTVPYLFFFKWAYLWINFLQKEFHPVDRNKSTGILPYLHYRQAKDPNLCTTLRCCNPIQLNIRKSNISWYFFEILKTFFIRTVQYSIVQYSILQYSTFREWFFFIQLKTYILPNDAVLWHKFISHRKSSYFKKY